jgi:asparagine synthase (glutamine-hydrolysing)
MCGVIGINCNESLRYNLKPILSAIKHRGPDSDGTFLSNKLDTHLGHTRLSILDLSKNGKQPMEDHTKRYIISYNGEIFNFIELKKYIEKKYGKKNWRTNTDTEVILEGFAAESQKFFSKLNGIYSFIIYDKKQKHFHVLRDPLGIKPLYYTLQKGSAFFSSEIDGLLAIKGLSKNLRLQSFSDQLTHMYIPEPFTLFNEFFKVTPGLHMVFKDGNKVSENKISFASDQKLNMASSSDKEYISKFRDTLNNSVKRQLISDVPISILLSGGLDSSAITKLAIENNAPVKSVYTISYNDEDKKFDNQGDDLFYSRKLSNELGLKLNIIKPKKNILSLLEEIPSFMNDGVTDPAALNTFIISKNAREDDVKVLLSGQGADEYLCGYRRYLSEQLFTYLPNNLINLLSKMRKLFPINYSGYGNAFIRRARRFSELASLDEMERLIDYFSWIKADDLEKIFLNSDNIIPMNDLKEFFKLNKNLSNIEVLLKADQKFDLLGLNLTYSDTMSMKSGVELRVPFLDLELVQLMEALPLNMKINGFNQKYILKKCMEDILPKNIIYRPKAGFGLPLRSWFRNNQMLFRKYFDKDKILKQGIYNYDDLKKMILSNRDENKDYSYTIYTLLCQQIWMEKNNISL